MRHHVGLWEDGDEDCWRNKPCWSCSVGSDNHYEIHKRLRWTLNQVWVRSVDKLVEETLTPKCMLKHVFATWEAETRCKSYRCQGYIVTWQLPSEVLIRQWCGQNITQVLFVMAGGVWQMVRNMWSLRSRAFYSSLLTLPCLVAIVWR